MASLAIKYGSEGPPRDTGSPISVCEGWSFCECDADFAKNAFTRQLSECSLRARQTLLGSPHHRCNQSAFAEAVLLHAAQEPFDECSHGPLLRSLWRSAFTSDCPFERHSEKWLEIGFQTEDPVRDLRGTGALGLRLLHHFCCSSGAAIVHLAVGGRSAPAERFPLAAASLNVTQMLCSHLGMLDAPAGGAGGALPRCSERVLDAVLQLQATLPSGPTAPVLSDVEDGTALSPSILELMHEQLLCWLHRRWQLLPAAAVDGAARQPGAPSKLMQFPQMLSALAVHLQRALEQATASTDDPELILPCLRPAGALLARATRRRRPEPRDGGVTLRSLLLALRDEVPGTRQLNPYAYGGTGSAAASTFSRVAAWLVLPAVALVQQHCPPGGARS